MIGMPPAFGGGLLLSGSGGGVCDPATNSRDPAAPNNGLCGAPGSGGGGDCIPDSSYSATGSGGVWGGGGSGDGLAGTAAPRVLDTAGSGCSCNSGGASGIGFGGAAGGADWGGSTTGQRFVTDTNIYLFAFGSGGASCTPPPGGPVPPIVVPP